LDAAHPPGSSGNARAGRARSRGRGAASGLRDPRDRSRPALGVLDPPRLDPRPAGVTPLVALRDVRLRHAGGFTLDVPALDVRAAEVLAVIGPNGSGKSTLLRVI